MNCRRIYQGCVLAVSACIFALSPVSADEEDKKTVNVDNFKRAESDLYLAKFAADGAFGRFSHSRELVPIDEQDVIRMNRDTLYSYAVIDLGSGPVRVTLPETDGRFMSLQVINEDHYTVDVIYGSGDHELTPGLIGTRYALLLARTFVNPESRQDLDQVHSLQDRMMIDQSESAVFEIPPWNAEQAQRIREILNDLADANGGIDSGRMFGAEEKVDPIQHLIGTAAGWGGNPKQDAYYEGGAPGGTDGVYRMRVQDVPVDGFWSVSVYNEQGYFEENELGRYSINSITAKRDGDGSVAIQFGGCEQSMPNCIPVPERWNYLVRLYQPHEEILTGKWAFPKPIAAESP